MRSNQNVFSNIENHPGQIQETKSRIPFYFTCELGIPLRRMDRSLPIRWASGRSGSGFAPRFCLRWDLNRPAWCAAGLRCRPVWPERTRCSSGILVLALRYAGGGRSVLLTTSTRPTISPRLLRTGASTEIIPGLF